MRSWIRFGSVVAVLAVAMLASAGTITVTSPAKGTATAPTDVKPSVTISFSFHASMPGATGVMVEARVFNQATNALVLTEETPTAISPNAEGNGSGSLTVTFDKEIHPEVVYRIEVRAREPGRLTETYNTDQNIFVRPDLTAPKILAFNPLSGSFVKGVVTITVRIQESNLKDWRVQVGTSTLPNGQGTTVNSLGEFSVLWDTSTVELDGAKTINIRVRDKADNEVNQAITLTVDRVKPLITIQAPVNNSTYAPGTTLLVTVDVKDVGLLVTGVDVMLRRMDGTFIKRVARTSFESIGNNTFRWKGRVRWVDGALPTNFKVHAYAIDRAGNAGTPQAVAVRIGG